MVRAVRTAPVTPGARPHARELQGPPVWQSSPPGSIYDYIRVASFSLGPDGRIDQWSERAEQLLGIPARYALGKDPVEAFVPPRVAGRPAAARCPRSSTAGSGPAWCPTAGQRAADADGLAEVYVMPSRDEDGERAAVCHRRRCPGAARHRDRPRRLAGRFRPISHGFHPVRHGSAAAAGQRTVRHGLRRPGEQVPRLRSARLPAAVRGRADDRRAAPRPGHRRAGHRHAAGRHRRPASEDRRRWSVSLYRLHSGQRPPDRRRRRSPPTSPAAAAPSARPPAPAATSPCSTRPAPG